MKALEPPVAAILVVKGIEKDSCLFRKSLYPVKKNDVQFNCLPFFLFLSRFLSSERRRVRNQKEQRRVSLEGEEEESPG
jgi:hypothetical protein